jgi:hypothetical protein
MNKLIRDGKVAILYSPGYGAGWYTWNQAFPELIFDPGIVDLVEHNKFDELKTYVTLKYPEIFTGGMDDLKVDWLPVGIDFRITEFDGNEVIETKDEVDWIIA